MGSIYKQKNSKNWWIKYYHNGRAVYESSKSPKKMVARELLKQREGDISQGKLPGLYFERTTFKDLSDDLLTDYRDQGRKSIKRVQISIDHLKAFFAGARAVEINTSAIQRYKEKRQEEKAGNGTINRELAALKRMFNLGTRQTPPKVARVPYIPMFAEGNIRQGFFEHHEFLEVKKALPAYLQGLVTFGYRTGWRVSEITGLTWDRVNMRERTVTLETGKTKNNEGRTVYFDDAVKALLKAQLRIRRLDCPLVFHREGKPIKDFRGAWKKACEAAAKELKQPELKERIFHDLRRTAVRNMIRAGIPERVAMTISGHKTRSVFDRYNIVSAQDLKEAARKQQEYLEGRTVIGTVIVDQNGK